MSVTSNLSLRYIGLLVCLAPGTFDRGRLTNWPQSNEHDLGSLKGIDQPSSAIPEKSVKKKTQKLHTCVQTALVVQW